MTSTAALFPVPDLDPREIRLFRSLDLEGRGAVRIGDLLSVFDRAGLRRDDHRIAEALAALENRSLREELDFEAFCRAVRPDILIVEQALQGSLVIPDFDGFAARVGEIHASTGKVADYIPQLAQVDPELAGVAVCTIDGQRQLFGDAQVPFCVQSCSKPVTYGLALELSCCGPRPRLRCCGSGSR